MTLFYDVLVIGGGHAGCEAAHASAMLGAKTCLVTMDMNKIAQMSCNPAVGGIAKGQIVREIDAMGGGMGLVTDATSIQFRMLNRSKGPAVWSPRSQCDRPRFIQEWRRLLDQTPNLSIWQDQAEELLVEPIMAAQATTSPKKDNSSTSATTVPDDFPSGKRVTGVRTIWGCELRARCVIITAGTFLNGLMHIGRKMVPGGRCAEPAALHLTESIARHGISTARMKTGTPVRIDSRSVHFEDLERQDGDAEAMGGNLTEYKFSYLSRRPALPQLPCWTLNTNEECHAILRSGLEDSPLYNGQIQSIGPRYCPSIETKLVTFADKDHHPLFLEPEGLNTNEMYLNGFSSSLPMDVQLRALRAIPALRDVEIYRPGYAIEYDFFDPTQLNHTLESKLVDGLFFAGQVNGTTGYEEAAGQGLMAGINAALKAGASASGRPNSSADATSNLSAAASGVLARDEAYIGVLIDDLVTKGVDEPYRMFTSRAEYRILLRQDDADARLTEKSYQLGLATRERYDYWISKKEKIEEIEYFCSSTLIKPQIINGVLESLGTSVLQHSATITDLLARPQLNIKVLSELCPTLAEKLDSCGERRQEIAEAIEIRTKYKGYINREKIVADKMHRLEDIHIRGHFDYANLHEISTEGRQKLIRINPETLAQASRIPGVSPSDINVLLVLMKR